MELSYSEIRKSFTADIFPPFM